MLVKFVQSTKDFNILNYDSIKDTVNDTLSKQQKTPLGQQKYKLIIYLSDKLFKQNLSYINLNIISYSSKKVYIFNYELV